MPSVGHPGAAEVYSGLSGNWGFLFFFFLQIHNRIHKSDLYLVESGLPEQKARRRSLVGGQWLCSRPPGPPVPAGAQAVRLGLRCPGHRGQLRLAPSSRRTVRLAHCSWTTYCIRSEVIERPLFRASFGIKMCSIGTTWLSSG